MASSRWITLFLLCVVTRDSGVSGRAVHTRGFASHLPKTADKSSLRADALRRWRRGVVETHCAELAAPWQENSNPALDDNGTLLQLRVRPFSQSVSQGLVFPGKSLFSFVRRVYRCCQEGLDCRSVKGLQGRLRGGTNVEFLLTKEILSLTVMRAELHLQISNPQHLDVRPVLSALTKCGLPTRYSLWFWGNTVELRVDLLFLLQSLQEAAGGAGGRGPSLVNIRQVVFSGDPPGEKASSGALQHTDGDMWGDGAAGTLPLLELGLVLGCSQAGSRVSCGSIHLSHTPFMALYYR